jgi:hypothetical protein
MEAGERRMLNDVGAKPISYSKVTAPPCDGG